MISVFQRSGDSEEIQEEHTAEGKFGELIFDLAIFNQFQSQTGLSRLQIYLGTTTNISNLSFLPHRSIYLS